LFDLRGTGWRYVESEETQGSCLPLCAEKKVENSFDSQYPPRYEHCSFENFNAITISLKSLSRRLEVC